MIQYDQATVARAHSGLLKMSEQLLMKLIAGGCSTLTDVAISYLMNNGQDLEVSVVVAREPRLDTRLDFGGSISRRDDLVLLKKSFHIVMIWCF